MDETRMTLTEHLSELRIRIFRALIATAIAATGCYYAMDYLVGWLLLPLRELEASGIHVIGTGVAEAFFTKLKLAFIGGIFVASPVILWEIWGFVAPGLYPDEKYYAVPFVIFGSLFFIAGALFCYELVLPIAYGFFMQQYASIEIEPFLRISEYLSFSARFLVAFGVVFELPVFTFFFARIGLVTHHQMIAWWRYAIVGTFIVAAILTPPEVASQLLMAGPLVLLYGASIGVAYFFGRPGRDDASSTEGPDRAP